MGVLNSISFVTGPLGCGKSYFAQKHVIEYLAAGKTVACNFDLCGRWFEVARRGASGADKHDVGDKYTWWQDCFARAYRYDVMDDLYDFTPPGPRNVEDRGLLVLDEAGLNMNSRLYALRQKQDAEKYEGNPIKALQFYINMRKRGWTCLILAHSSAHVDNQVQSMGGGIIKLRNYARIKIPWVGVPVSKKPKFNARYFTPDVSGTVPEFRQFYGLDPKIASTYRSEGEFEFMPESRGLRLQREPGPLGRSADGLEGEMAALRGARAGERERPGAGPPQHGPVSHPALRRLVRRFLSPSESRRSAGSRS